MVIVDTSAWIEYFRSSRSAEGMEVERLLRQRDAVLVSPVLGEIIRGARSERELRQLVQSLERLPFVEPELHDWMLFGEISVALRQRGATVGYVDTIIAAIAINRDHSVYAVDTDFARIPNLRLHVPAL